MTTHTTLLLEERVFQILEHLGIKKAHFAAKLPGDWQGFVTAHPECVDSLTLLCPRRADPGLLKTISPKLLVITGDLGREVSILRSNLADLSEATVLICEPMLATGGSLSWAVDKVKGSGATDITALCVVTAPEGVKRMYEDHPDVQIIAAAHDRELNDDFYIVPGLGDMGDRLFGTL